MSNSVRKLRYNLSTFMFGFLLFFRNSLYFSEYQWIIMATSLEDENILLASASPESVKVIDYDNEVLGLNNFIYNAYTK